MFRYFFDSGVTCGKGNIDPGCLILSFSDDTKGPFDQVSKPWKQLIQALDHFVSKNSPFLEKVNIPADVYKWSLAERDGIEHLENGKTFFEQKRWKPLTESNRYIENQATVDQGAQLQTKEQDTSSLSLYMFIDELKFFMEDLYGAHTRYCD